MRPSPMPAGCDAMTAAERQQRIRDRRKAGLVRLDVFVTQDIKGAMVELMREMRGDDGRIRPPSPSDQPMRDGDIITSDFFDGMRAVRIVP